MKEQKQGEKIIVKGARTHNLKNITVEMPRNKIVVFTGLSGSGKSSLAFDTIFAEGQRRYVESLSAYARQFLNQMQKPDVDEIVGLSPAISIDQKSAGRNPRSTVATITEIYDYLRVLYARIGKPYCLICGDRIKKLSNEEILSFILEKARKAGRSRSTNKVTGVKYSTDKIQVFAPMVRGRKGEYYQLIYDMLGKGFTKARLDGKMHNLRERIILNKNKKHEIYFLVDEINTDLFMRIKKSEEAGSDGFMRLSEAVERALQESEGLVLVNIAGEETLMSSKFSCPKDGFSYPEIEPRLFSFNSPYGACEACHGLGTKYFFSDEACDVCNGKRLRKEALNVYLSEKSKVNIVDLTELSISDSKKFFDNLNLTDQEKEISSVVIKEINSRLEFLLNVGLDYLSLDRRANTLSGGEAQRIRLASQLGSRLVGALYVLDEPTIGLHQRDNEKLIKTLTELRDMGNTIIIVEHDEDTIYASDYIVDIGPGAGVHGGNIVVADDLEKLLTANRNTSKSITLDYLRGDKKLEIPQKRRNRDLGTLRVKGGKVFNIKNMNIDIPLGRFTAITGVSGSGKSSLMYEILYKNLQGRFERKYRTNKLYNCEFFTGTEYASRAILIDQSPIGRTPRSNPATYTGAFTFIRDLFAETEEARLRGWKANRFSFNVKGGRCEACQGNGEIAVEMHFLPTVYVTCDICQGKRFMKETLEVKYKKKSIYDVLKMTTEEAENFFQDIPQIYDRLKTLMDVGLGYLELGQSATTLSGGEAQRVKISSELYRPHLEKTIYLLDEPTIGLHYEDVKKLIEILQKLVDKGNTVMLIEHNMDILKSVDYIIDIGPEGGAGGGKIIARGTPEEIAGSAQSYTGKYLKKVLRK
ncbi:MAG: excinuclease ABC subunit A [Candidatus Lloydbacteria bacterium RIFCSPHIGHO2_01_FULL_41_20]|uniref:UvrABC system protein A n=1 Tax=Candidatus Lloydbacteria bacterium RIFCSPHIGHO2_01_FULL_41_20 TaxID=1798657 RepID=A0A1G2CW86_9BACT|nr:MAG: excinuclease ABC subunit A [Candidatus Lloydbacteria bacterium RIFCSPHIGHO2_01_FULL_41_20]